MTRTRTSTTDDTAPKHTASSATDNDQLSDEPDSNGDERQALTTEEGLELLDSLFEKLSTHEGQISVLQHQIGTVLWRMDPQSGDDWKILAKRYGKSDITLKIWLRTASRLRQPPQGLPFSVMAELARIPDKATRDIILASRPASDWTLESMRAAVNKALFAGKDGSKQNPLGPQARGGTRVFLDDDRRIHVKVLASSGLVTIEIESTQPLDGGEITRRAEGSFHRVEFTW